MYDILFIAPANSIHAHRWIENFSENKFKWISFQDANTVYSNLNDQQKKNCEDIIISKFLKKPVIPIFLCIYYVIKLKPKVIHVHSVYKYAFYSLLIFFFHKKIILTIWGSDFLNNRKNFFKKIFFKFIFSKSKYITTDGLHIKNKVEKVSKFSSSKIEIINFGLDKFYTNTDIDKKFVDKNILKLCNTSKKIIFSSRGYDIHYGYLDIIESAHEINEAGLLDFIVILCGSGGNEEYKNIIDYKIKRYNLMNKVHCLQNLGKYDLKYLLSNSYVYISSSRTDAGISASICESMSQNIPVIAEDNSDNCQWVINGLNGFTYDLNKRFHLTKKILQIKDLDMQKLKEFNEKKLYNENNIINEMGKMKKLIDSIK